MGFAYFVQREGLLNIAAHLWQHRCDGFAGTLRSG